ncbi:hypothetical protein [Candidatus Magnetaquicoccus inordinatus]|uniref:hypothetical protein n=1 Tax=Candidatus Magnetaquicoccus inordinatus TaxID=2496818 RepID=UPI00102BA2A7|nr:hypothetical protein [Candidatus Magnetaquicoccus inordinatus]
MICLDELEEDTLRELFNLSFGRAAATLSEMVDGEISLSVPCLRLLSEREIVAHLLELYGSAIGMVGMRFRFVFAESRAIAGMALLLLRAAEVAHLLDALYGNHLPDELLLQVEEETMQSTGDLLLYTCVSSLSALLLSEIDCAPPHYYRGTPQQLSHELLPERSPESGSLVDEKWLLLRVDFSLLGKDVAGSLLLWMDGAALPILKEGLDRYLADPLA